MLVLFVRLVVVLVTVIVMRVELADVHFAGTDAMVVAVAVAVAVALGDAGQGQGTIAAVDS